MYGLAACDESYRQAVRQIAMRRWLLFDNFRLLQRVFDITSRKGLNGYFTERG